MQTTMKISSVNLIEPDYLVIVDGGLWRYTANQYLSIFNG